ncbi:MAG: helix-turn-helix transcriptional regulator [Planctomycetota bacterium]|nr:helix-turn-helix transcriptional regulator [Planctomycetota bacterium]
MPQTLTYLEHLLRAPLSVVNAQCHAYPAGTDLRESIVPTPRLLLAMRGTVRYTVEGRAFEFRRGTMLLIPERTRRSWRVAEKTGARIAWVEFAAQTPVAAPARHLLRPGCPVALESEAFARLRRWHVLSDARHRLLAEGELKALLARFLCEARMPEGEAAEAPARTFGERAVVQAMDWLGNHFAEPAALDGLPERVGLSPNHFRILFKKHFGSSAQRCLTALRMRAARALLQESARTVKEVAHAVGYRDPLFFSRHYRAFWKRSPAKDRLFSP